MNKIQTVDVLRTQGIMAKGYGIIPQIIARDERLTPEAKSIYCYFSSFAGAGFEPVFPSRDLMLKELNMSKDRYYRHLKLLMDCNYITVERERIGNLYSKCIYTLVQLPNAQEPVLETSDVVHVPRPASIRKRLGKKQDNKDHSKVEEPADKPNQPDPVLSDKNDATAGTGDLLRRQLGIDLLIDKRPDCKDLIQSIYMVVEDMATSEQITINGAVKKKQAIRNLLGSLRMVHIETIVNNIQCSGQKIRSKKAYIQSCIGNILIDVNGPMDYSNAIKKQGEELKEAEEKEKQRHEYELNPDLKKLDQLISDISIRMSKAILSGDELKTKSLRNEKEQLDKDRQELVKRLQAM